MKIPRPEDDRAFRLLKAEQAQAHASVEAAAVAVQKSRNAMMSLASRFMDPEAKKAAAAAETERMTKAVAAHDAARAQLRAFEPKLTRARSDACERIVQEIRPEFSRAVRKFMLACLERHADEISATVAILAARDTLKARRIGLRRLTIPGELHRAGDRFTRLRADTMELIEAGVLKPADIPKQIRTAWGL